MKINRNKWNFIFFKYILTYNNLLIVFFIITGLLVYQVNNIYLSKYYENTYGYHIKKLDKLLIQDVNGRIKPFNTIALELLRKVYSKDTILGMNASDWFISISKEGWIINRYNRGLIGWLNIPFIKVDKAIRIQKKNIIKCNSLGYSSLKDLFYINFSNNKIDLVFQNDYIKAFNKNPKYRNNYDKAILKLAERIFIVINILEGRYFKCLPLINHSNKLWMGGWETLRRLGLFQLDNYFFNILLSHINNDYSLCNKKLHFIELYQHSHGKDIIPNVKKIYLEIFYNKVNVFYILIYLYLLIFFCFVLLNLIKIINRKLISIHDLLLKILTNLVYLVFTMHSLGLIVRGYISSHAPWTNGYESAVFISWAIMLSSLYYFIRYRNKFIPLVSSLASSLLLIIANSNIMDPEITNIVPVLNSYWLIIHVFIIICSYGCLIFGSFLGLLVVILFILKNKYNAISNLLIKELTIINELSIIIGLIFLIIGTFLGGVWANESWGSYWSWDPKETWALITIMIYAFVLHSRFIPKLNNDKMFNILSCLSVFSVLITYFGVNYYLSGLHSYGKGEIYDYNIYWNYYLYIILIGLFIFLFARKILFYIKNNLHNS